MPQLTIQQAFEIAVRHHQAGRLQDAEAMYRQILALQPDHAEAIHFLGLIALQVGRHAIAADLISRAIALKPDYPEAHNNLGNALKDKRRLDERIEAYRRAIALKPDFPEAHGNLGTALRDKGQLDEAIAACRHAIALRHDLPEAHNNLGLALHDKRQFDQAITAYRQAIALRPNFAEAHSNLGIVLRATRQLDESIAAARRAIALKPDFSEAHCDLGNALRENGQLDEAIAACRRAIVLRPDFAEAHNSLGNALKDKGQFDEAIQAYRLAIALKLDYAEARSNLGNALKDKGRLDDAIEAYRQAIALKPDLPEVHGNLGNALRDTGQIDASVAAYRHALVIDPGKAWIHSNLVYALHFHPRCHATAIYEEAARWNQQHAAPLARSIRPHDNDRDPDRLLRIGYVSANFRNHPVAHNFLPLAVSHNQDRFRVVCYSTGHGKDAVTDQLRLLAGEWREGTDLSDERLAEVIRRDKIDILVDLGMHMAGNRLLVFARKPAPVQVAALCSMGTTGMPVIDYRISDRYSDPPDFDDACYAEKTVRLPDCYFCHEIPRDSPPVNALPAVASGHITFGSLNAFSKVSSQVLHLWSEILSAVPHSRLLMRCPSGSAQARVRDVMAERGIAAQRIEFLDRQLASNEYFCLHHRMDIGLDPFPYCGHTTSLDGLWMGIPLITLAGQTDVGRSGIFLLTNLHMPELIAHSASEYLQKAIELANDLPRLAGYRVSLRQRMLNSPILDTPRFARNVEAAYREMWKNWCKSNVAE